MRPSLLCPVKPGTHYFPVLGTETLNTSNLTKISFIAILITFSVSFISRGLATASVLSSYKKQWNEKNFFLEEEFSKPIPSSRYGLWTSSQSFIMTWVSYAATLLPSPPPSIVYDSLPIWPLSRAQGPTLQLWAPRTPTPREAELTTQNLFSPNLLLYLHTLQRPQTKCNWTSCLSPPPACTIFHMLTAL